MMEIRKWRSLDRNMLANTSLWNVDEFAYRFFICLHSAIAELCANRPSRRFWLTEISGMSVWSEEFKLGEIRWNPGKLRKTSKNFLFGITLKISFVPLFKFLRICSYFCPNLFTIIPIGSNSLLKLNRNQMDLSWKCAATWETNLGRKHRSVVAHNASLIIICYTSIGYNPRADACLRLLLIATKWNTNHESTID